MSLESQLKRGRQTGTLILNAGYTGSALSNEVLSVNENTFGEKFWELMPISKLVLNQLPNLEILPAELTKFADLSVIEANYNPKLASLCLTGLATLVRLDAQHCKLSAFDTRDIFASMPLLSELRLAHNELEALPALPPRLHVLDVSHNKLAALPSIPPSVQTLNAQGNKLTAFPHFEGDECKTLNLAKNALRSAGRLPAKLVELDLRNNAIETLGGAPVPAALKEVHLSHNRFADFPEELLGAAKHLEIIDLAGNGNLASVPASVADFKILGRLDLSNCALTGLPAELGLVRTLKALGVEGNAIKTINRSILTKGTLAVMEFLRTRLPQKDQENLALADTLKGPDPAEKDKAAAAAEKGTLDLSARGLTALPELQGPRHWNRINLSDNKIEVLDEATIRGWIASGITVDELVLANNEIKIVAPILAKLTPLNNLVLLGNPIKSIPMMKLQAGTGAVKQLLLMRLGEA